MNLDDCRKEIDRIDQSILGLLNQRLETAQKVGSIKEDVGSRVYIPLREKEIYEKLLKENEGPLTEEAVKCIFKEIISASLNQQKKTTIAYLGPEGTFTHEAARNNFGGSAEYTPIKDIQGIFKSVERGEADYGVVPIENSTEGAIKESLDLLMEHELSIIAEIRLKVELCLMSLSEITSIKKVYSNPYALRQCAGWLNRHLNEAVIQATISAAVKKAKEDSSFAAIGSHFAAELYDLPVLAECIHDKEDNTTRFLILSRDPIKSAEFKSHRTSLALRLKHECGVLSKVLQVFSEASINLLKIESRPIEKAPWEYRFFIDIEGHCEDSKVKQTLELIGEFAIQINCFGSYPESL